MAPGQRTVREPTSVFMGVVCAGRRIWSTVVIGCQCSIFSETLSSCVTANLTQQISDSADFEKTEHREYEPRSQGRRGDRKGLFFLLVKVVVKMKIDEGKHCSWLVLSGKNAKVRAGQLTHWSGGK